MNLPPALSDAAAAGFRKALLRWFRNNRRPLPWREGYHPYRVWIAEIMLQQTQVETALPYYRHWMERFPNPASVAAASQDAVLKAWEGLGYYSRARNLQQAARRMVEHHGGQVPTSLANLRALPGVGRYTAGAIASIAFNRSEPAVDGNVARVLTRLFGIGIPVSSSRGQSLLWGLAAALVPPRGARDFNQGLMELGALVCRPKAPACPACPLASRCQALGEGRPERYPVAPAAKSRPVRQGTLLLLRDATGSLLLRKRPPGGVWAGLWEPPWIEAPGEESTSDTLARLIGHLPPGVGQREALLAGEGTLPATDLGTIRHGLTHLELHLRCFSLAVPVPPGPSKAPAPLPGEHVWVSADCLATYPLPKIAHKALALERSLSSAPKKIS